MIRSRTSSGVPVAARMTLGSQVSRMDRQLTRVTKRNRELFLEVKGLRALNRTQGTTIQNLRGVAIATDNLAITRTTQHHKLKQDYDEIKVWAGGLFLYSVLISVVALCL